MTLFKNLPSFQRSDAYLFIAVVAVLGGIGVLSYLIKEKERARAARFERQDQATLKLLVEEVNAISEKLGRVPRNELELVELLGKPMPEVRVDGGNFLSNVEYLRTGDRNYVLHYFAVSGAFRYESDNPIAGWYQSYKSPDWKSLRFRNRVPPP